MENVKNREEKDEWEAELQRVNETCALFGWGNQKNDFQIITILCNSHCPVIKVCAMHVIVIVCLVTLLGHSVRAEAWKWAGLM